jgi:hypothetical protein
LGSVGNDAEQKTEHTIHMNRIDIQSINWDLTNREISESLGVTPSLIAYYRKQTHLRKFKREKYRIDWTKVDWTKPDHQIAKENSVTCPPVCTARRRFAPEHLRHASPSPQGLKRYQRKLDLERAAKEAAAMRNAAVIYTADLISQSMMQDQELARQKAYTASSLINPSVTTVRKPDAPKTAQPSWVKRKLIAIRDWLFNLCVSVEKEANK